MLSVIIVVSLDNDSWDDKSESLCRLYDVTMHPWLSTLERKAFNDTTRYHY